MCKITSVTPIAAKIVFYFYYIKNNVFDTPVASVFIKIEAIALAFV